MSAEVDLTFLGYVREYQSEGLCQSIDWLVQLRRSHSDGSFHRQISLRGGSMFLRVSLDWNQSFFDAICQWSQKVSSPTFDWARWPHFLWIRPCAYLWPPWFSNTAHQDKSHHQLLIEHIDLPFDPADHQAVDRHRVEPKEWDSRFLWNDICKRNDNHRRSRNLLAPSFMQTTTTKKNDRWSSTVKRKRTKIPFIAKANKKKRFNWFEIIGESEKNAKSCQRKIRSNRSRENFD